MTRRAILALAAVTLVGFAALAEETVPAPGGSSVRYPTVIDLGKKDDKPVRLKLTGVAMREKLVFNVYAVGSYVSEDATVKNADELASCNQFKRLHLVMERDVDGQTMADSFRAAVRANYPEPAFADEIKKLTDLMQGQQAKKGESIWLTHVPDKGLHIKVADRDPVFIANPAFPKAVWDIYLGKNNLGDGIKKGLTARLGR